MLCLSVKINQLAIANSVCWYGHVLRMTLELDVESQGRKARHKKRVK